MSPAPREGVINLYSSILRGSYKPAFLYPEEEIQGLTNLPGRDTGSHKSATGLKQNALNVFHPLPPNKGQTDQLI
jgi:hypothetical protein